MITPETPPPNLVVTSRATAQPVAAGTPRIPPEALSRLIVLHDTPSTDLTHLQAKVWSKAAHDGFALFDYVKIQEGARTWIGQIVEPNQNISTIGNRLDPTVLHGLELMQEHPNVQAIESVQIFDILILGQEEDGQMLTPRIRPLPGAVVSRLDAADTSRIIGIPVWMPGAQNVIGELLNAENVPLCITPQILNYHMLIAGGTGSGKSNAAANVIHQATRFGKCVLVHDAKPDYGQIGLANTDSRVEAIWARFATPYGLAPHAAESIVRIGFQGKCDPNKVDDVIGFRASDFSPDMLAGFFFTGSSSAEQNAFEGFARSAEALKQQRPVYSLDDILNEVKRRDDTKGAIEPDDAIHVETRKSILRKVNSRRREMPWLDSVGQPSGKREVRRLHRSSLDTGTSTVRQFDLENWVQSGRIIVIDYSRMDDDYSYALVLSYFLRICQQYRKQKKPESVGLVHLVDEAHRIFDNESRHSSTLARGFERVMREGRSVDHSILLSLQNASQIPPRVMNNLNSKIVMRQNSKAEADAATQTMGKEFAPQAMRLGTGHALVSLYEAKATILAQMAPSPFELMRTDNAEEALPSAEEESYGL